MLNNTNTLSIWELSTHHFIWNLVTLFVASFWDNKVESRIPSVGTKWELNYSRVLCQDILATEKKNTAGGV